MTSGGLGPAIEVGKLAGLPSPQPSVFEAWSDVMEEVQGIGKGGVNTTPGQNYRFRGIDAVMNAVGPALRHHGVAVIPSVLSESSERYETRNQAKMVNRVVRVEFRVFGPRGDSFTGISYGEAADSGDKAVTKAQSVAYRTFLLQALTIPTDEQDPDSSSHERVVEKPATLADVKSVADRARASREDVENYFLASHRCAIADSPQEAIDAAYHHFTQLSVSAGMAKA